MTNPEKKKHTLLHTSAFLEGHFKLTSGLHSKNYVQCARILQFPDITEAVCKELAEQVADLKIDKVLSPAIGGIIVGYEMARIIGCKSIFAERKNGEMMIRRGFKVKPGENILIAEDVITTGGSVLELKKIVEKAGGTVVAFSSIINRSGGAFQPGVRYNYWYEMEIANYKPEECPMCQQGMPLFKPGSREEK